MKITINATGLSERGQQSGIGFAGTQPVHEADLLSASAPEWQRVNLELADDEVHVWIASLDALAPNLPQLTETLSASELYRAGRFQFGLDRSRFIARRGLLRILLARYLDADPAQLSFSCGPYGKPEFSGLRDATPLQFNSSHSSGLVLFAVARRVPVGVDIERLRPIPDIDRIAAKFFSSRENTMLGTVPAGQRLEAFFNCWTRKEAYLKATGDGITDGLLQIEVSLAPGQRAELLSVNGDSRAAGLWFMHSLAPAPGFVGAIACLEKNIEATKAKMPSDAICPR